MKRALLLSTLLVTLGLAAPAQAQQTQCVTNALAGGTVDAIRVLNLPCGLATNILILTLAGANTVAAPTLQMAGFPALPIQTSTGASPGIGSLPGAGAVVMLTGTGSAWRIVSGSAASFSGTLAVANGGTGRTTLTSNGVLIGAGTGAIVQTAAGTNGKVLTGNTGSPPTFQDVNVGTAVTGVLPVANGGTGQSSYTDGQLLIGNTGTGGLNKATLTAGSNMVITNSAGGITLTASGTLGCSPAGTSGQLLRDNGAGGCATTGNATNTGNITALSATAIPAGGTAGSGYLFSSTANYGVFFGSGVPTLSAAQGSLYLRSDGAPYYNTNGSTAWSSLLPTSPPSITVKTANYNVVAGDVYCTDTVTGAATVTATLPGSPSNNDTILFVSCSNYSVYNLVIARNGNNIQGLAENMTVNTNNASFHLVFVTSYGWRLY